MNELETRLESLEHGEKVAGASRMLDHLGIFFYVLAGLTAFFAMIPILHVLIGVMFLMAPPSHHAGDPPPAFLGGMFVVIGSMCVLLGLAYSALLAIAGRNLRARTRPTLVTVAAVLSCLNMPFGTALGIITLIELNKPEVRNLFKPRL